VVSTGNNRFETWPSVSPREYRDKDTQQSTTDAFKQVLTAVSLIRGHMASEFRLRPLLRQAHAEIDTYDAKCLLHVPSNFVCRRARLQSNCQQPQY
jgi:hypothetical protein